MYEKNKNENHLHAARRGDMYTIGYSRLVEYNNEGLGEIVLFEGDNRFCVGADISIEGELRV